MCGLSLLHIEKNYYFFKGKTAASWHGGCPPSGGRQITTAVATAAPFFFNYYYVEFFFSVFCLSQFFLWALHTTIFKCGPHQISSQILPFCKLFSEPKILTRILPNQPISLIFPFEDTFCISFSWQNIFLWNCWTENLNLLNF
jgi:hypothetical protein